MTTPTQPTQQPAGWYPDNTGAQRYWDGNAWTEHVAPQQPVQYAPAHQVLPPGFEIRRKRPFYKRVWFWLIVIPAVFIIGIIVLIAAAFNSATNSKHTVTYSVTSNGKTAGTLSYLNINGNGTSGSVSGTDAPLPFSKTVTGKGDFSSYTLTATAGTGATSISCKITVDGNVQADQTATGPFALVSCSASGSN